MSDPIPSPANQEDHDDAPAPGGSTPLTMEQALEVLEKGKVTEEHGAIRWSSNYTFLLSVTHEDTTVLCVYKPRRGERPLWDFPDGTLANRERASFLTSQELGWQIVPPTVLRDGPRGIGSMQLFIEHDPAYTYFEFDASLIPQVARLAIFDVLVNNADRKGGHCLVDSQNHLWGIDQGLTFNVAHKLRTVIWDFAGQAIPQMFLDDIERLCGTLSDRTSTYRQRMDELLNPDEIAAFDARIQRLLTRRVFPKPGAGPNYPWPPV